MNTPICSAFRSSINRFVGRRLSLLVATFALSIPLLAQTDTPPASNAGNADSANSGDAAGKTRQRGQNRGNFNPEEMQQRMMTALREQFGVTDDAEWTLISERITKVAELRRSVNGGFGGMGLRAGATGGRPNRPGAVANPDQDALRVAVTDKLPDAEVKARLARLRETRKQNEEKLTKAQEDLRSVLSVRQEAVAVLAGLLP
jgi:hypothetical protein